MANQLDVINQCLAIMGEAPLNSLAEDHEFKASAVNALARTDRSIQGKGWWYNTENLYLTTNPSDGRVYLPGDCLTIRLKPEDRARYVPRGRVLYDLVLGTDQFRLDFGLHVALIRSIPLEDCPVSINELIAHSAVLAFQQEYDGDQTKTRNLYALIQGAPTTQGGKETLGLRGQAEAEHIRNIGINFIHQSDRLSRIARTMGTSRGSTRR